MSSIILYAKHSHGRCACATCNGKGAYMNSCCKSWMCDWKYVLHSPIWGIGPLKDSAQEMKVWLLD